MTSTNADILGFDGPCQALLEFLAVNQNTITLVLFHRITLIETLLIHMKTLKSMELFSQALTEWF